MKLMPVLLVFLLSAVATAQDKDMKTPPTLKSILLEQLRTTHNVKDWFVPANVAVEGLTAEQANWKDGKGNHSVGQLTYHLLFWNREELAKFKGEPPVKVPSNNDETFDKFDSQQWAATVKQLDEVMTDWEESVEAADDKKLESWYSTIAHIASHNAYHIGQIVFVRKEQGSWDPDKGVK